MNMIKMVFVAAALLLSLTEASMAAQSGLELTQSADDVGALRLINHPDPIELKVLQDLNLRIHT